MSIFVKGGSSRVQKVALGALGASLACSVLLGMGPPEAQPGLGQYLVIAQNDLGMHCMQRDYSYFMILPPFNTVHAMVIKRGFPEPDIIKPVGTDSVEIYIPSNTTAIDKTNWWEHAPALLGVDNPADIGVTGSAIGGSMTPDGAQKIWEITGMPMTPMNDAGIDNPYPLATVVYKKQGTEQARTQMVVPVSWELNCSLCHGNPVPGENTDLDVLQDHDRLHGTNLVANAPVACSSCHADPAIGAPGDPNLPTLSSAIHTAHADRIGDLPVPLLDACYACHPGERAQCQRDVHLLQEGMTCMDCHISMQAVGNPARTPWVDEPRCGDCHNRPGFDFEQPGVLFRNSKGHGGVKCFVCHGSPHAITPTPAEADNIQSIRLQGVAGTLNDCTVCHIQMPNESFFHKVDD